MRTIGCRALDAARRAPGAGQEDSEDDGVAPVPHALWVKFLCRGAARLLHFLRIALVVRVASPWLPGD